MDVAETLGIIKRAGAWYSYNDEKLGQGRDKSKEMLEANPELLAAVEADVRAALDEKNNPKAKEEQE